MKPSTKTGMAEAPAVTIVVIRSAIEYRLMADTRPTVIPMITSMMIAQMPAEDRIGPPEKALGGRIVLSFHCQFGQCVQCQPGLHSVIAEMAALYLQCFMKQELEG